MHEEKKCVVNISRLLTLMTSPVLPTLGFVVFADRGETLSAISLVSEKNARHRSRAQGGHHPNKSQMISRTKPKAARTTALGTQIIEVFSLKEPFGRLSLFLRARMTAECGEFFGFIIAIPPAKLATGSFLWRGMGLSPFGAAQYGTLIRSAQKSAGGRRCLAYNFSKKNSTGTNLQEFSSL